MPSGKTANRWNEELSSALATVNFFQGAVQHADDKARTVITLLGVLAAFTTAQFGYFLRPDLVGAGRLPTLVALALFALTYAGAVIHIVCAIVPNTVGPPRSNRFSFPSVAHQPDGWCPQLCPRAACQEAWQLAKILARRALIKHRHVRSAIGWTACAYAGLAVSTALLATSA